MRAIRSPSGLCRATGRRSDFSDWAGATYRTAIARAGAAEVAVHPARRLVDHALDRAQRVVPIDELLKVEGVLEAAIRFAVCAHGGGFAGGAPAVL